MGKILKIGRSDFGFFIKNRYYLVDKTKLIYDFHHNSNDVVLFPRPKRFGKTLNLSMIEYFYDIQKQDYKEFFAEFEIAKYKDFCNKHQNKYPVINLTLKAVKETSWDRCLDKFRNIVSDLYTKHEYLINSDKLGKYEKQIIEQIIDRTADEITVKGSLVKLSEYLEKHFNQKVVILVDEYDTPIISAFNNTNSPIKSPDKENKTYYEKLINFMLGFLGEAYKENDALFKGMITGVMRVGETTLSEWNDLSVFGITSNYFSDSFGFTKEETEKILDDFNLSNKKEEVKQWYGGYKFGK
ncbi:MAG: AAA family ATPase, partial [Candidatus Delongbacteria bacterium]